MSALFSSPKSPPPPPIPATPAPTQSTAEVQAAADGQRARVAQAMGRSSTLLNAPDTTPTAVPTKTLLGSG